MSVSQVSQKRSSRQYGLSLAGLGTSLALGAPVNNAHAAIEGSDVAQNIAASGTSVSGQTLTIPIDIDGDGNTEFDLVGYLAANTSEVYVRVLSVEAGSQVVGTAGFPGLADKLDAATSVDGSLGYVSSANLAWSETKGDSGNWVPVSQRGYVGVAFDFEGNTHYGSLDVELTKFNAVYNSASAEFDATLHGYTWETIPGKSVLAGAEASASTAVSVPTASWYFSLVLIAGLCLVGMRRLRNIGG